MPKKETVKSIETKNSDKTAKIFISACLSLILLIVIGSIIVIGKSKKVEANLSQESQPIQIVDGKQIINIYAKNGFSPNVVNARAGVPVVLKVRTNNTFDCSATMSIPKLGITESLPPTGTTDLQIPAQMAGTSLDATCSMQMFYLKINFTQES